MLKPPNFDSPKPLRLTLLMLALLLSTLTVSAQTTTFTYQGKLADTGTPANGSYDFQFKLYDALTDGSAFGGASANGVTVANGIFTVDLDFGVCSDCFNGANRFLEISVKPTSGSIYTTLSPRQQITSAPYSIKSQNATSADGLSVACVNCVTSSQIASVSGSAIVGAIPVSSVPAGSGDYIQNTLSPQASSNFNISGDGTAAGTLSGKTVNAETQYNLGGARVLSNPGSFNLFAGVNAGVDNMTGIHNSFFGYRAGSANTSGSRNSIFGTFAGLFNMTGDANSFFGFNAGGVNMASSNSFFGNSAGQNNSSGSSNSFFGDGAGNTNMIGSSNSFFGSFAGAHNTASSNSFFGASAGFANITGSGNSFFGYFAGANNAGSFNSFVGDSSGRATTSGGNNSFFGYESGFSNTLGEANSFFGRGAGHSNGEGDRNSFFGFQSGFNNTAGGNSFFGTNAGLANNTGSGNSFFGDSAGGANTIGDFNSFFGFQSGPFTTGGSNVFFGYQAALNNTTGKRNVIIGTFADFRDTPATSSGAVAGDENIFLGYQAGGAAARRNAAAIGRNSFVACDDCMVLGTSEVKVGIGMTTPQQNLSVNGGLVIDQANLNDGTFPGGMNKALTFGSGSGEAIASQRTAGGNQFGLDFYTNFFKRMTITNAGDVGIGTTDPLARLHVIGETHLSGKLVLGDFGTATATHLCLSGLSEISFCSSSLRYKTNVLPLNSGLELIRRLRPVTFDWKTTGQRDLGLIAEEVDTVEPLLVTRDKTGQIQGVKYDQLNVLLINAVNEQQAQIQQQQTRMETQQAEIDKQLGAIQKQQTQIEDLLKIVCLDHPAAPVCKPKSN